MGANCGINHGSTKAGSQTGQERNGKEFSCRTVTSDRLGTLIEKLRALDRLFHVDMPDGTHAHRVPTDNELPTAERLRNEIREIAREIASEDPKGLQDALQKCCVPTINYLKSGQV